MTKSQTFDQNFFKERTLVVASKHNKEQVIVPMLSKAFSLKEFVISPIDTDKFGTFSGEKERTLSPLETARIKCKEALLQSNHDLVIASEGSFGPHPTYPFLVADDELLLLWDKRNNIEIWAREVSSDTNFGGRKIDNLQMLLSFANQTLFPKHSLILKDSKDGFKYLKKGISNWTELVQSASSLLKMYDSIYVETDMRASYNPSRMKVIEKTAHKLLQKLNSLCEKCSAPGFGLNRIINGLRCEQCGTPTNLPLIAIHSCLVCKHEQENHYPKCKKTADPLHCDVCNP